MVQEEGAGDMVDGAREGERGQGKWGRGTEEETGWLGQGEGGGDRGNETREGGRKKPLCTQRWK